MTNKELKEAFMSGAAVMYGDVCYQYIYSVIYRKNHITGDVMLLAELMDKHNNSITTVNASKIELAEVSANV